MLRIKLIFYKIIFRCCLQASFIPPEAMQVACRWAALGRDSRIMVEYALIQEERRNETH